MTTFTSKRFLVPGLISLILLILLATLPLYTPGYTIILLTSILMYVVLTVSWAISPGPTGYISLATSAFFGVGLYTSAILGKALPLLVVIGIGGLAIFMGGGLDNVGSVNYTFTSTKGCKMLQLFLSATCWQEKSFRQRKTRLTSLLSHQSRYHNEDTIMKMKRGYDICEILRQ